MLRRVLGHLLSKGKAVKVQQWKALQYTAVRESSTQEAGNIIVRQLRSRILATGPISVAEYMKEVLINPASGYYMQKDVFGQSGDFITSPEISQLFGEMLAVWVLNEWKKVGSPKPLQLVELGPGRGTLADDMLRVLSKLEELKDVTLHLVEVSPHLSKMQEQKLCGSSPIDPDVPTSSDSHHFNAQRSKYGIPVYWYRSIEDVPEAFSVFMAHEFFDALPIHKFQKIDGKWKEILIDVDPKGENSFRFVVSTPTTLATKLLIKADERREHIEVSPESGAVIQHLAKRIEEDGGIALIVDYGHDGSKTDTFRAFRNHQLHDPLKDPGTADLTADVDFSYLRELVKDRLLTFGPVNQRDFFRAIGIDIRLEVLLRSADEKTKESLLSGYHMLTDGDKMGNSFKFFAMFPNVLREHLQKFPVAGF